MIGIVWYSKKQNGVIQFEKIIKGYQKVGIPVEIRTPDKVVFNNQDNWLLMPLEELGYGLRCNVSYIDCEFTDQDIDMIIKPITSLPPYNAIRYY